jgi:hypothetical protein
MEAAAPVEQIRATEIKRGLQIKRNNAVTAICTGGALALVAAREYAAARSPLHLLLGLLAGILYANVFEYILHRFLLHWGEGFLVHRHAFHHDSIGTPLEARYANFATSPLVVVLVFALNGPSVFILEHFLRAGLATGMFAGFTLYYVLYEEIHWRIHFGGWLPGWLQGARRHHMLHHGGFKGRYSVFLPIFDWLFERGEWKRQSS